MSLQELFVQHLALSSFSSGSGKETNSLTYSDLAHTAEETETFHFLTGETNPQCNSVAEGNQGCLSVTAIVLSQLCRFAGTRSKKNALKLKHVGVEYIYTT